MQNAKEIKRKLDIIDGLTADIRNLLAKKVKQTVKEQDLTAMMDEVFGGVEAPDGLQEASAPLDPTEPTPKEGKADTVDPSPLEVLKADFEQHRSDGEGEEEEEEESIWELWDNMYPNVARPKIGSPEYVSLRKKWHQGRPGSHPRAKGKTVALPKGKTVAAIHRILTAHPEGLTAQQIAPLANVTSQSINYNCKLHMYPWLVVVVGTKGDNRARIWALAVLHPEIAKKQQKAREEELGR